VVDRSATVKHKSGGELNIKPLRARTCGLVGEPISVRKYSRETAARKWQPQSPLRTPAETSAEHPKDEVPAILRITGEIRPRSGSQNTELALQAARDDPRPPAGRASHPRDGGGLVWPSHEHPLVAQRHHRHYIFFDAKLIIPKVFCSYHGTAVGERASDRSPESYLSEPARGFSVLATEGGAPPPVNSM
jgi:hypothetical protein